MFDLFPTIDAALTCVGGIGLGLGLGEASRKISSSRSDLVTDVVGGITPRFGVTAITTDKNV
jgi:hypothetical protein